MDATTEFFDDLDRRGHEPLLEKVTGTFRFDLVQAGRTDHRYVAVRKGDVVVSDENAEADLVMRADRELFDGIASGKTNVLAAALRGEVAIQGDPQLALRFQRLFPGPANTSESQEDGHPNHGGDRS
jgi:putative sterol carrier protein